MPTPALLFEASLIVDHWDSIILTEIGCFCHYALFVRTWSNENHNLAHKTLKNDCHCFKINWLGLSANECNQTITEGWVLIKTSPAWPWNLERTDKSSHCVGRWESTWSVFLHVTMIMIVEACRHIFYPSYPPQSILTERCSTKAERASPCTTI